MFEFPFVLSVDDVCSGCCWFVPTLSVFRMFPLLLALFDADGVNCFNLRLELRIIVVQVSWILRPEAGVKEDPPQSSVHGIEP